MANKNQQSPQEMYERYQQGKKNKKSRKFRRKMALLTTVFVIVSLIALYFISPVSRINNIFIRGNSLLSNNEILKIASIDNNAIMIFVFPQQIEKKLESNPFIKDAEVKKGSKRNLEINIIENTIFAYHLEENPMIFFFDGSEMELTEDCLKYLIYAPYINGFYDDGVRNRLRESFLGVDASVYQLVSEIHEYETSYDSNMVRIVMQDGNQVFSAINSLEFLNYYVEILNNLKVSNSCIYFNELSHTAYSSVCPEDQPEVEENSEADTEEIDDEGL